MKLEILSLSDALKFIPYKKTYSIRIFDSDVQLPLLSLRESKNWVFTKNYFFDDVWPEHWKEFLGEFDYLNAYGMHDSRNILFDENLARKILKDYEHLGRSAESVLIHCVKGNNRSPAIGMAMNEIFEWGIPHLKEKFPNYRKWVYEIMMDAGKEFRKK